MESEFVLKDKKEYFESRCKKRNPLSFIPKGIGFVGFEFVYLIDIKQIRNNIS
jgi:hypothetical protein